MKVDYSKVKELPENSLELFKIFMRLEFALKALKYCYQPEEKAQKVNIDWESYANAKLGEDFFARMVASRKADALINNPPQTQVTECDGALGWKKVGRAKSVNDLLASVRRVRNNLFHGGKHGDADCDRNPELVSEALFVIDEILKCDSDLHDMFAGNH
ncbi:MAG: hypothetical protein RID23_19595 [Roseovarius sp.]